MNVLVTGGAGFIASHLVDAYVQAGHNVVVVDNLSTGDAKLVNPKAHLEICDIRDESFKRLVATGNFDLVNHHAAQIDVRIAVDNPSLDAAINILGSLNCIEGCLEGGVKKLIFISSGGAIYGEIPDTSLPVTESFPPRPLSPYGESKYTVERYLYLMHQLQAFPFVTLRYGNVYGERQGKKGEAGVVSIFARLLLKNKPVTIYGNGEQLRDYIHISDVVSANMLVSDLNQTPKNKNTVYDFAYNIGTGTGESVNRLHAIMENHCQTGRKAQYAPPRDGEIEKTFMNCSKAKNELGWQAQMSFADGLVQTVEWFRHNPDF